MKLKLELKKYKVVAFKVTGRLIGYINYPCLRSACLWRFPVFKGIMDTIAYFFKVSDYFPVIKYILTILNEA